MPEIIDRRKPQHGLKIKHMRDGTWFLYNGKLRLRVAYDFVVDVSSGTRSPFNEEAIGLPVEVEIHITRTDPTPEAQHERD